jgi:hypothetical protein
MRMSLPLMSRYRTHDQRADGGQLASRAGPLSQGILNDAPVGCGSVSSSLGSGVMTIPGLTCCRERHGLAANCAGRHR